MMLSRVQCEIAALGVALVQGRRYLMCRFEYSNDQIFSGLIKKLVEEGRKTKINFYGKSQNTVHVYADG